MSAASGVHVKFPSTPWGMLPPSMRVLFITNRARMGAWLATALAADGATSVELEEAVGVVAGMSRLRDEVFDTVLISHDPDELDALDLVEALRTGSREQQPIIVLGNQPTGQMAAMAFEVGADGYLCIDETTTRNLIWQIARAAERCRLISENHRLQLEQKRRVELEQHEAQRLLEQQWAILADSPTGENSKSCASDELLSWESRDSRPAGELPAELLAHYQELLRAYVIMGSGSISTEMGRLTELLSSLGMTGRKVMRLHLQVLGEMVQHLGARSARHVVNRADLLALEVLVHLDDARSPAPRSAGVLPRNRLAA